MSDYDGLVIEVGHAVGGQVLHVAPGQIAALLTGRPGRVLPTWVQVQIRHNRSDQGPS